MKLTQIDIFQVDLPYAGGTYRLSGGRTFTSFDATFVRLSTDTGLTGWGESTPFGATYVAAHGAGVRAGLDELAPSVLGLDPRQHDRVSQAMDRALAGHPHAKTPIDVACWDLHGKAFGLPVCDLLGGRTPGPVPLISSIGSDTPEAMRASVASHRSLGYVGHSIKIGASEAEGGPQLDADRIAACLADRCAGEWFLVDANGGLSVEHALRMLALVPVDAEFVLEAPCATWAETARLRARCRVPLLLDELIVTDADLIQAIREDLCDGVGLKISKQGGITPTLRQRTIATAAGLVMSIQDTTGSDIAMAGVLSVAGSTDRSLLRCALDTRAMVSVQTATLAAPIRQGGIGVPDTPGLGIEPDMNILGAPVASYGL